MNINMKNIRRFENFNSTNNSKIVLEERQYPEVVLVGNEIIEKINNLKKKAMEGGMTDNRMQVIGFVNHILTLIEEGDLKKERFEEYVKEFTETMEYHSNWYNPSWLTKKLGLDVFSGKSRKHYDPTAKY